ncbi:MAG: cation diffusion facilitator family transporter [Actinomycetota bacterium]
MTRSRRLQYALALNLGLVVLQAIFGVIAHSLGLLADAGHNLVDVAAVGLSLFAVRLVVRPATTRRTFGYHRSTVLAAQVNGIAILAVTALIMYEGVRRLIHPTVVHPGIVIPVATAALVVNLLAALVLHDHSHDLNVRSALLHMVADAVTSAGVVLAGVIIAVTHGTYWLDPLVSMLIGVVIAVQAFKLLGDTTAVLLEGTPDGIEPAMIVQAMLAVDGVDSVHDLHTWSLSSEVHAISAHVVLAGAPTLMEAQERTDKVRRMLSAEFGFSHTTLEPEAAHCRPDHDRDCTMS